MYFAYKNPDFFIDKWARERAEIILNDFEKLTVNHCKGSYEDLYAKDDQPLYYKSDQRIDFMIHIYQEIIKRANFKLTELAKERKKRLQL